MTVSPETLLAGLVLGCLAFTGVIIATAWRIE